MFELILAANYMDIKPLLDLTCATVASMIKVSPHPVYLWNVLGEGRGGGGGGGRLLCCTVNGYDSSSCLRISVAASLEAMVALRTMLVVRWAVGSSGRSASCLVSRSKGGSWAEF